MQVVNYLSMVINICILKERIVSRRWCCSGTPISTEVKDFTRQFAFLGLEPFGNKAYFNNFVSPVPIPSQIYLCKNAAGMCSA